MRPFYLLSAALIAPVLVLSVACSKEESPTSEASGGDSEVIGGVDAKSASLDAIGALVYLDPQTQKQTELCTATLITPAVVLTAKHCAMEKTVQETPDGGPQQIVETRYIDALQISFAVGPDIAAPKKLVGVESVETCNVANSGFMGLGCDVAIYRLKEAITDVTPLEVAKGIPTNDEIGKRRIAIGYGIQEQSRTTELVGTRKLGSVTLRAITGSPLKIQFPESADQYIDAMRETEGEAYVDNYDADLRAFYDYAMLEGYEFYTGGVDGDVQICSGDSGGPLLAKIDGKLVVQGVASGTVSGVRLPCKFGAVYAGFGPKAQELLEHAVHDPCEGVPAEGRCEGDVAVRCTTVTEGPRRLTRTDCSDALQRCIAPVALPPADPDGGSGDGGAEAGPAPLPQVSCGD